MTTTTTTRPAITHPAWCDPDRCSEDRLSGVLQAVNHWSRVSEFTMTAPDTTLFTVQFSVWLTQFDDYDGPTCVRSAAVPYLEAGGEADAPLDQIEALGAWLIARAAEYREAIDGPEAALAAAKRHAAEAVRPFMPGLARTLDAEGGAR